MNNYQVAKNASYKLIVREAKNDERIPALIPTFATGINRLEAITVEIDAISIQQAKIITGITSDKNFLMDELGDFVLDVSGAMHSYATSRNDKILAAKINYKETAINRMSQARLLTVAGAVLQEAGKITAQDLANEGISEAEMTKFRSVYTQFETSNSKPREAIIDRSGYTLKLAGLFAEASELKKNTLDRLARQFARKNPEFYLKYKAASIVIYKRNSKTAPTAEAK